MRPSDNGFYIRLVTPKQLSQSEARSWYSLCRRLLPSGVISSMQAVHPTEGIQDARMVHRTLNSSHQYEIPLTRDLLEQETERVVFQWDTLEHNGDFSIETSASQIQAARHQLAGAIDIPASKYKDFCETLAKHQHARWCSDRTAQGWRYGMQHDAKQKTTPLLRPWQDLPQQYQNVDEELPALFLKLLDDLGLAVVDKQEVTAKQK